ncbi:MAG: hypothetical protein R3F20_08930 [Planctomycetota bacterium]
MSDGFRVGAFLVTLALFLASGSTSGQTVPDRILVGYWHNWAFPNAIPLAAVPEAYDVVNVSFAVPSTTFGSTMVLAPDAGLYPNPSDFDSMCRLSRPRARRS